jgi:hypothetical protein
VVAVIRRTFRGKVPVALLAAVLMTGWLVSPGMAHDSSNIGHNWRRHYAPLAKRIFYTKIASNNRFINLGEQASNSNLLDGLDSTAFADASHAHSGNDITSGTVADARIDALLARDVEVFGIVTAVDGSTSGLDADLLDGQSSATFADASHAHSGNDITTGTVAEARIDALLARDVEVFGIVTAADGSTSGLDADLLDGQSSAAFADASHAHSGNDITSGTVDESVIDILIARVADVFDIVLASDGPNSGLNADLLDGFSSGDFVQGDQTQAVQWFKESADSLGTTATSERVVFTAPEDITITGVFVEPAAALTASDLNYATITLARRDAGGGNKATVATQTTQTTGTGNWTAFGPVSLGSLSTTALTDGQKVTLEITKPGGVGVILPVLTVQIEYTVN